MNASKRTLFLAAGLTVLLSACQTAEEAFIGDRLLEICDESYYICNVAAGCVLDKNHYVEGVFPGVRRVVVATEEPDTSLRVRIFFNTMESPGSELLAQIYEPDCSTLNPDLARAHLQDVDLFEEAGDDRSLIFELDAVEEGEHLLAIYSDAAAEYLLIVEKI